MKCPGCGTKYSGNRCPSCGRHTDSAMRQRQNRIKWGIIGGVVLAVVILVGLIYVISSTTAFYNGLIDDMHNAING